MENNIIHTLSRGERVTSAYAETYLNDDHCDYTKPLTTETSETQKLCIKSKIKHVNIEDKWTSPSDLLIGIIELKPPFTSKITRGKTHEGILAIGNEVLQSEIAKFMRLLTNLIHENDSAWSQILEHEKASVRNKVKKVYGKIYIDKSKIMKEEIDAFYETTLQELEIYLKSQVDNILISAHANIIRDLNTEIKHKLEQERIRVEKVLQEKYEIEVDKLKHYYKLLLRNEIHRNNNLVNIAINERNDAMKAFYRQIEAENITSTMYVMCLERKKCKIKQFILENYQSLELSEKYQKIKERQEVIAAIQERDVHISVVNQVWQQKIKKVLEIFLKFISFSLKLLPEQTTFLLDIKKMVVLQLNEIKKSPKKMPSIIVDEEKVNNMFKFKSPKEDERKCVNEPFLLVGDLSDPIPPHYGSRETLPSNADLPVTRLQRQYVYAKCHGYEEIKTILEAQRCKCSDIPSKALSQDSITESSKDFEDPSLLSEKESSNELLLLDDIRRLQECPVRRCKDWAKRLSFPFLNSYLDFTEENYERVKVLLGHIPEIDSTPERIDPKKLAYTELPFSVTKEPYHTVETQYSSQEDLYVPDIECPCTDNVFTTKQNESSYGEKEPPSAVLNKILAKRKVSLRRLLQENPNLLKMFTDESFDFVM
ncbi:Uncharacterized protein OBRU01_02322 [Operophtera brumata]|uniref:Uncharacterized protein n=1 Tax=Operophtera brumata TaxID=104452 RepID=A0A0L7LSX6_OPEBR|nr:Uncharacterized protein OBRU01_02322 [Operophtera brumata]